MIIKKRMVNRKLIQEKHMIEEMEQRFCFIIKKLKQ